MGGGGGGGGVFYLNDTTKFRHWGGRGGGENRVTARCLITF